MAILMHAAWAGVSPEQYSEIRRQCDWVNNPPEALYVVGSCFDSEGTLHFFNVWESADDLQEFVDGCINPVAAKIGITTKPEVHVHPCLEAFAPRVRKFYSGG